MAGSIKIRAKIESDGACEVKALIKHTMETGMRKDKDGEKIPAKFIQEILCKHGDKVVLETNWGGAVSKNPYISFRFDGASKGDKIELSWTDNTGESDAAEAIIK
ncbi:MAG: thiosulfate oxidation carrier complex protein SoxZ [Gammaproteobacteria bacterium]|nr:thiosulfate oxidation carrier complex protein SoxZ [Gammaproteobacteria bacterium]